MKEKLEGVRLNTIIFALLCIIFGLAMVIFKEITPETVGGMISAALVVIGLVWILQYIRKDLMSDFYRRDLVNGLFFVVLGIVVIVKLEQVLDLVPVILGMIILFCGMVKLQYSIDLARLKYTRWGLVLAFAVINILYGIIMIVEPKFISDVIYLLLGIGLIISGVTDVVTIFVVEHRIKNIKKDLEAAGKKMEIPQPESKKDVGVESKDK